MFAVRELATSGTELFCSEMLLVMEETQHSVPPARVVLIICNWLPTDWPPLWGPDCPWIAFVGPTSSFS